jgi:uncharacterized protein
LWLAVAWLTGAAASAAWAEDGDLPRVVDQSGLLRPEQARELEEHLDRISQERGADVVVLAVDSLGARTAEQFADDYFDYGPSAADPFVPGTDREAGYGLGKDRSGILMLVCPEYRDWAVSTRGDAIKVFTDSRLGSLREAVQPYLGRDDWANGFFEFADRVDSTYHEATLVRWGTVALVAVIAGLIGGFLPVTIWRHQLKSVKPAANARPYLQTANLVLTASNEQFIGQSTRVIDMSSSGSGGGGGSSTHIGSSGASHGGFSGKF